MADLSIVSIVCVIATPMAWEHHYGALLPIFIWLWFAVYRPRIYRVSVYRQGAAPVWPLALAFLLIADFLSPLNLLAAIPVANLLQSYMYFGALLLLALLASTRASATDHTGGYETAP
jgi:hypothetical protein